MTWARLDDTFHHHPKLMEVDLAAVGLYALGLSYAADNLTDGRLPERWVRGRTIGDESVAQQLVEAGLGEQVSSGFVVHDFGEYNLTREQIKLKQEAGRRGGLAKANGEVLPEHPGGGELKGGSRDRDSGQGSGSGRSVARARTAEFEEWIEHYRVVTGRTDVRGSQAAREQFNARRQELSLDELKAATLGCHSDDFCREHKHDVPETILRASKVTRYIQLGKAAASAQEPEEAVF